MISEFRTWLGLPVKAVLVFLLFQTALPSAYCQEDTITNILWAGSSSTYVHDMPLQVGNWLNQSNAFDTVVPSIIGRSGTSFHEFLKPGFEAQYGLKFLQTFLEKIEEERNEYVVIQQIAAYLMQSDSLEITQATREVCQTVREAGGIPVIFEMGWPDNVESSQGREAILLEAKKNGILHYGPCSRAWEQVRNERPDIELHNLPDQAHPGTYGAYLNFCCMHLALTGVLPPNLPDSIHVWPHFGSFDKDEADEKMRNMDMDPYFDVFPDWLKRNSVMGTTTEIPDSIASYLGEVALQNWSQIMTELEEYKGEMVNYTPTPLIEVRVIHQNEPFTVELDASSSYDLNAEDTLRSYVWEYGDGSEPDTLAVPVVEHVYALPGKYTLSLRLQDSKGEWGKKASMKITLENPAGIPGESGGDFQVYPNPVQGGILTIRCGEDYSGSIEIIDLMGSVWYSEEHHGVSQISLSTENLNKGFYLVRFRYRNGTFSRKVLVE